MTKFYFQSLPFLFIFCLFVFGQSNYSKKSSTINNLAAFPNPLLINADRGCDFGNLKADRFDNRLNPSQQIQFCEALQEVSNKLNHNWSPDLKSEVQRIWEVFLTQNIKIRPMKSGVSSRIVAAAESFTENTAGFNASLYLRPEKLNDKIFFLSFMHELRHTYDFYLLWDEQTYLTEVEFEKRGFRIMSKLHQEMPDKESFFRLPTFWNDDWKSLSVMEIERKREVEIENFMRGNDFYKHLLKNPEQYKVGIYRQ